jgi:hypothetical protein
MNVAYLTLVFQTCARQLQLAIWPSEKSSSDFDNLMDGSVTACADGAFTTY